MDSREVRQALDWIIESRGQTTDQVQAYHTDVNALIKDHMSTVMTAMKGTQRQTNYLCEVLAKIQEQQQHHGIVR